jgi:hypothetical protein
MNLGMARRALGFEPSRFDAAEANLIEAHGILVAARGETHKTTLECVQALVDFYEVRGAVEPGEGYRDKGAAWQARLGVP